MDIAGLHRRRHRFGGNFRALRLGLVEDGKDALDAVVSIMKVGRDAQVTGAHGDVDTFFKEALKESFVAVAFFVGDEGQRRARWPRFGTEEIVAVAIEAVDEAALRRVAERLLAGKPTMTTLGPG